MTTVHRNNHQRAIPWHFVLIYLFLIVGIAIAGYVYYQHEKSSIVQERTHELSAIADLKVKQIQKWRVERLSDARFLFATHSIAKQAAEFSEQPSSPERKRDVLDWMSAMYHNQNYESMSLYSADGNLLMKLPQSSSDVPAHVFPFLDSARQKKNLLFTDFHFHAIEQPRLAIIVPLFRSHNPESLFVGSVILEINPYSFLYPLIQSWPTVSRTSESLILRLDGDSVLFLNELRHKQNTAMQFRLPFDDSMLPAAQAAHGKEGIFEGIDYRGVEVLSATRTIHDSPWFLVAKVDREELFSLLNTRAVFVSVITTLLMLFAGTLLAFIWRHQRAGFYRELYNSETERAALLQHFEYLTKYANDIILLVDKQDNIIEANDRALETYQYTRDELLNLNIRDLRTQEAIHNIELQRNHPEIAKGLIYETTHRRKDKTTFHVEVSNRMLTHNGRTFYQEILRDITERKKSEARIMKLNRMYATLSQINQMIVRVSTRDELFRHVCSIAHEFGKFRLSWFGINDDATNTIRIVSSYGFDTEELKNILTSLENILDEQSPSGKALHQQKCVVCNNCREQSSSSPWCVHTSQLGFCSSASVPILFKGTVNAVFSVYADEPDFFDEEEIRLLEEISGDISFALDRFEAEIKEKRSEEALLRSEVENRAIINAVPDLLFKITKDGTIVDFRAPSVDELYVSPEMFLGKHIREVLPPQVATPAMEAIEQTLRTKEVVLFEYELLMHNELRSYEDRVVALNESEALSIIRDITTRKQAETALKESEFFFKESQRVASIGSYKLDAVKGYWDSSEVLDSIFGIDKQYSRNVQGWLDIVYPDDREMMNQYLMQEVIAKQQRFDKEYRIIRINDKQERWVHGLGNLAFDAQGNILTMIGTIQDITDRKLSEQVLKENEERYRGLVESQNELVLRVDMEGRFTFVNDAYCKKYGLVREEILGKQSYKPLVHPDDLPKTLEAMKGLDHPPYRITVEQRTFTVEGVRWVEWEDCVIRNEKGEAVEIQAVGRDIHDRKLAEEELRKLRKAVEASGEIVFMTDNSGVFSYINPAFTALYGYTEDETVGKQTPRILKCGKLTLEHYQQFWNALLRKEIFKGELINKTKEGRLVTVEASANPILDEQGSIIGFLAIQKDITERKQLEEQYFRAQRMESLGTLASGIAHDLNNVLTPLLLGTELLRHKFRDEGSQAVIASLENAAKRGKGIIEQILTFARGSEGEKGLLQLKHIVREMEKIIRETFPKSIRCQIDVQRDLSPIIGNATQLHQVLMNLCVNSRDAMPHTGTLLLKAENKTIDEQFARLHIDAKPGTYTVVSVTDTGVGAGLINCSLDC